MADKALTLADVATMGGAALLTLSETAQVLRVTERTLERWRQVQIGPKYTRIGPRRIFYSVADVLAFAGAEAQAA